MKKNFMFILIPLLVLLLVSCGPSDSTETEELRFYLWNDDGGTPTGFTDVLNHFNEEYAEDLGVKVKFSFDTLDDYKQNLNLMMSANQDTYDVVFDAGWIYLNEFANKGYYHNLENYFHNTSYPGLKKAFSDDFLSNNLWNNGVYGIPLTQTFGEIAVTYLRKDWRLEAANDTTWTKPEGVAGDVTNEDLLNGINSFEEMEYYLYWVKANKENIAPVLTNNDGNWGAWDIIQSHELPSKSALDKYNAGIKTQIRVKEGVNADAYIRNNEVIAVNIGEYLSPDAENGLSDFPAGFQGSDDQWETNYQIARKWFNDGIIHADVMSTTDSDAQFKAGMGGAVVQTINNFSSVEASLKGNVPGAELEIFVHEKALREKRLGYAESDFKAWNFLSVPKNVSKAKLDKIMKFMDWLFVDEANHDLFQYGIKGTHWDEAKDDDGEYIPNTVTASGMETYTFPAYELTWNPNYIRVNKESDPKVIEYSEYMFDPTRYVEIIHSEFQFNIENSIALSNALNNPELSSATSVSVQYHLGQINNPVANWQQELNNRYNNASLQADLVIIQQEIMTQLQDYIDSLND